MGLEKRGNKIRPLGRVMPEANRRQSRVRNSRLRELEELSDSVGGLPSSQTWCGREAVRSREEGWRRAHSP